MYGVKRLELKVWNQSMESNIRNQTYGIQSMESKVWSQKYWFNKVSFRRLEHTSIADRVLTDPLESAVTKSDLVLIVERASEREREREQVRE